MKRIFYGTFAFLLLLAAHVMPTQLRAQTAPPKVKKASAFQVLMMHSHVFKLPA